SRRAAFVRSRADHLGCFEFDQRLEHQLHAPAHDIEIATRAERVEQLGQVRLAEGHRRVLLREPGKVTPSITPVAHPPVDPGSTPTYTTSRDVPICARCLVQPRVPRTCHL